MVLDIYVEMSGPSDDLNAFKQETKEHLSFIEQAKKIEGIKIFVIEMKQRARVAG
ncbi:hypothetical protein J7J00_27065 [Bacillus sp. ISL-4]|uniref:hypothetical protein n=1 Tax=Bacillus sp. ISL-4 TaxID=2819125 RepID=UPI001BECD8EB|nr:hypothetical protein [Bacillus sp. ISL-4]MBT2669051.1 hypothetical protein [Bacillus sp. ISL-4]MBT2674813.1 hypothetical protein [Streptomyces sp. ISL-14]